MCVCVRERERERRIFPFCKQNSLVHASTLEADFVPLYLLFVVHVYSLPTNEPGFYLITLIGVLQFSGLAVLEERMCRLIMEVYSLVPRKCSELTAAPT